MKRIETAIRATLDDRKLSRSERTALATVFGESTFTEQQRGVVRSMVFNLAREAMTNHLAPTNVLDWLEDVLKLLQPSSQAGASDVRADAYFSPGDTCRRRIGSLLRHARKSADVCVFTITDNTISDEILAAHRRGVSVRIISDNDKSADRGSDIPLLERLGVPVRMDLTAHHMHHKFALFDDTTLLTGSYNWTVSASESNEENLIVTNDNSLVRPFRKTFDALWRRFEPRR